VVYVNGKENEMRVKHYLQSAVIPANKFRIVAFDKATKVATLEGPSGAQWEEELSDEKMEKLQYTLVKEVEDD
jgi:hypothetical protein